MAERGRVRLVVLNYDGGHEVVRCFDHLTALRWPPDELELVLIDNGSSDGSAHAVAARHPSVEVVQLDRNRGFPANNVALRDLAGVRYVGLVNNDAFVEPDFLAPLVEALEADRSLGAACPLMLFEHQYVELAVEVPAERPGPGDPRELGVKLTGARVAGEDVWRRVHVPHGGHGLEVSGRSSWQWTAGRAVVRVPVRRGEPRPDRIELRAAALSPRAATFCSGRVRTEVEVHERPSWIEVAVDGEPVDVVNNAGSVVFDDGYGADRGFGEVDSGQFDEPAEVFAWCGGAVLLRPDYLADVGLFDEHLFLYYEDTDLSWRGQARGWRYRFVPHARVRHLHAATSIDGSARFQYFTERNRLLVLAKNAPVPLLRRALGGFLGQTYDAARRDIAGALAQGRRPNPVPTYRRLRAGLGFLRLAPYALRARRRLRRRQTVSDAELLMVLVPTAGVPPSSGPAPAGGC
jgi:GT2 family glycosyltransferase